MHAPDDRGEKVCSAWHGFGDLMSSTQVWHEQTVTEAWHTAPLLFLSLVFLCCPLNTQDIMMPVLLLTGMGASLQGDAAQGTDGTATCYQDRNGA